MSISPWAYMSRDGTLHADTSNTEP